MASYSPAVGGGVLALGGGTVIATVLPQTGAGTTIAIAVSASVALMIWGGMYLLNQRKAR